VTPGLAAASPPAPDVERFRRLIGRQLGLFFEDGKLGFLAEVLRRRLEATVLDGEGYLGKMEHVLPADEAGALGQELTVPETYFFRNIDQFSALTEIAVPAVLRAQPSRRVLRLLSAGCASGEEPYSLAMALRDRLPDPPWSLSIRGVDLNPAVLQRAARATFSSWALRETPPDVQRRWFRPSGRDVVLDEAARAPVTFEARNLALDDPELWQPERWDVVFCRNVIMYFTPQAAAALIERIARSLVPGGFLFLGHAETLRGLSHVFHLHHTHGTFYYQRKGAVIGEAPAPRSDWAGPAALPLTAAVETASSWIDAIQQASDRIQSLATAASGAPSAHARADLRDALDLLRRERFSEALDAVRELPPEAATDPDVLMLEAALLTYSGQLERAEAACHRLLALDELSAGAHHVLALCREARGDLRAAVEQDQVAVYLDPAFAMPRLHLGLLARRAGDREGTRREMGQAMLLLQREDSSRLLLFGGGFGREALIALCTAELQAAGEGA